MNYFKLVIMEKRCEGIKKEMSTKKVKRLTIYAYAFILKKDSLVYL